MVGCVGGAESETTPGGGGGVDAEKRPAASRGLDDALHEHLALGKEFTFRVTVLHALGVPAEYSDVFCQFHFLNQHDEAFSTEPVRNTAKVAPFFPLIFRFR